MKRRILAIIMAVVTMAGASMTAFADGNATITFTQNKELEYGSAASADGTVNLGDAFKGVAPGETRSQTITLTNANDITVDFYMSTEVLQALEESKDAAMGAGYDIILSAGGKELYNSTLGGYNASGEGSTSGLGDMNASLGEDVLIATLAKGETADVVLQITFDGESMGSTGDADYTNALGKLSFDFKAGYEEPTGITEEYVTVEEKGETTYITTIVEERVPLAAQTGDNTMLLGALLILVGGIVLFVATGKKKKAEE